MVAVCAIVGKCPLENHTETSNIVNDNFHKTFGYLFILIKINLHFSNFLAYLKSG